MGGILSRGFWLGVGVGLALATLAHATPPEPVAAASPALVEALEDSALVVVVDVGEVRRGPGPHAHVAVVRIEQVLAGEKPAGAIEIAWDELAPSRRPRLRTGDRALVGLDPVVGAAGSGYRLAHRGRSWWPAPDGASVGVLTHYLALEPALREGPTGLRHLLGLAATAPPSLARSAVRRLASIQSPAEAFWEPALGMLVVRALSRPALDEVGPAVVRWLEGRPSVLVAGVIDRALTEGASGPFLYAARAVLPGGLPGETWARLAVAADPELRWVVAGFAPPEHAGLSVALASPESEPVARVRQAAVEHLGTLPFDREAMRGALADPDASVRLAAARAFAARGDDELQLLRDVAFEGVPLAQQAALTALRLRGSRAAARVLQMIADEHPSEGIRTVAGIALGAPLGEVHPEHP